MVVFQSQDKPYFIKTHPCISHLAISHLGKEATCKRPFSDF